MSDENTQTPNGTVRFFDVDRAVIFERAAIITATADNALNIRYEMSSETKVMAGAGNAAVTAYYNDSVEGDGIREKLESLPEDRTLLYVRPGLGSISGIGGEKELIMIGTGEEELFTGHLFIIEYGQRVLVKLKYTSGQEDEIEVTIPERS